MQKEDRKSRTLKLRKIELLIWLAIILVITLFSIGCINKYNNSFESHTIYLPDVYGLIVGSPVNLMGVSIGYVTKTKIIKEDVILVKFKITDKSIHLPKNTLATVEMYGLAGSKSLELYPPNSDKMINPELLVSGNDYFLVERPKRLRDCLSLLYDMYKTLMNIFYSLANFSSEMNHIDTSDVTTRYNDSMQFINYTNGWINNSNQRMQDFKTILEKTQKGEENEQRKN